MDLNSYLVFDFETSGTSPADDRIIQVGLCAVADGRVTRRDEWLVNQDCRIDPEALRMHGISRSDLQARGIPPQESLAKLLLAIQDAPMCVGHNIHEFDLPFLAAACRRIGLAPPDSSDFVDTAALYKGWKLGETKPAGEPHGAYAERVLRIRRRGLFTSLEACCRELGVRLEGTKLHRAEGDAYLTHRVFKALKERGVGLTSQPQSNPV